MYAAGATSDLRQGDICAIPHVPIWNLKKASTMSGGMVEGIVLPNWDRVEQLDRKFLVTVCTQCCDLENPRARTGISIAPLMKVPARPGDERYERIMSSAVVDVLNRYEYVNLFPLKLPIGGDMALVADFSAIMTMAPMPEATEHLLDGRVLTMSEDERTAFREKLGFMFGRDPDTAAEEL